MNFLLRNSVEKSVRDFDEELKSYFKTSRTIRSKMRNGTIILVDASVELYKFFSSIVQELKLPIFVVRVDAPQCLKDVINTIGDKNVKALLVDIDMMGKDLNGSSLASMVNKEFPSIPVWVSHCPADKEQKIRKSLFRVGIFSDHACCLDYVKALGLTSNAKHEAACLR